MLQSQFSMDFEFVDYLESDSLTFGGGGGPTTKKTKDILRFSRRHDLFCSFLSTV